MSNENIFTKALEQLTKNDQRFNDLEKRMSGIENNFMPLKAEIYRWDTQWENAAQRDAKKSDKIESAATNPSPSR